MKCFLHQTKDALGFCKHCAKGVCTDCANDIEHIGLTCPSEFCITKVKDFNKQIARNSQITSGFLKNRYLLPAFFIVFGAFFLALSLFSDGFADTFSLAFGGLFTSFGILFAITSRFYANKKTKKNN